MRRCKFFHIDPSIAHFDRVKMIFIEFMYKSVNFMLKTLTHILWPRRLNASSVKKICIYRVGNIGDILCSIPSFLVIRKAYPNSKITLLTSPGKKGMLGVEELLKNPSYIDQIKSYYQQNYVRNVFNLFTLLRKNSYDMFIYLPKELDTLTHVMKVMFFARIGGVKLACGFWASTIRKFTKLQSRTMFFANEVERLMNILLEYDLPISNEEIEYDLPIPQNVKERSYRLAREYGLNQNPVFAFVPGAKRDENKWPVSYFVELGLMLKKEFPNCKIVILGGGDVVYEGGYIYENLGSKLVVDLAGKTSLLETASLLDFVDVVISNNTGTMHMASLAGVGAVGIFSSAEFPGKWYPYGPNTKVLIKNIDCQGCYYTGCKIEYKCIKSISPKEVFEQVKSIVVKCI